jgi:RNA-directed DNA polymerase
VIVRYADDMVIGYQNEDDARDLLAALTERLSQFGLAIHEGKTRLIAFGRRVAQQREQSGMRRPETFDFLGFTHYCSKTRSGRFMVKKKTQSKRMIRKLKALRSEMKGCLHLPVREYYGVIFNYRSMERFRNHVAKLWFLALRRKS